MKQLLLVPCLVFSLALGALAAEPLNVIPQNCSAVLRLKAPKTTIDKTTSLAKAIQPGTEMIIEGQASNLGLLISNPTMEGVDDTKDWWVVVFTKEYQEPGIVFVIPATDVEAMYETTDESFEFLKQGSWGIYSEDAGAVAAFKEVVDGAADSLEKSMPKSALEVFTAGDVSVYVNIPQLAKTYGDQIDNAQTQVRQGLAQLKDLPIENQGVNMAGVADFYGGMAEAVFQAVDDAEAFVLTLGMKDQGIQIDEFFVAKAETKTAKALSGGKPGGTELINSLPEKQLAYFSLNLDMAKLTDWSYGIYETMLQLDEERLKSFDELFEASKELGMGKSAISFRLGDLNEGAIRVISMSDLGKGKKEDWRQVMQQSQETISGLEIQGMKIETEFTPEAETIDGFKVDVMKNSTTFDEDSEMAGLQQQILEVMYGPEGETYRWTFTDKGVLSTFGGGQKLMKEAITTTKSESSQAELQGVLSALPQETSVSILADLPNIVSKSAQLIAEASPVPFLPIDSQTLRDLELSSTYSGFSFTIDEGNIAVRTYVPVEQIKNAIQLGTTIQQMSQETDF